MLTKSLAKKLRRKQIRCQHIVGQDAGIECTDDFSKFLVVCNAGLSTGLQLECLLNEIIKYTNPKNVQLIPGKSYCFIECHGLEDAQLLYNHMHGQTTLAQNNGILYLSYCKAIPSPHLETPWQQKLPNGLILLENFIDEIEENEFLTLIDWNNNGNSDDPNFVNDSGNVLKHRQVKHFGYEFLYGKNTIDCNHPLLDRPIPMECQKLWLRLNEKIPEQFCDFQPEQMTANRYEPGQGIPQHVDTHSPFTSTIISLSLAGDIVMEFRNPITNHHCYVYLPKRSLLIMTEECRYGWTHGITSRKYDIIYKDTIGLTTIERTHQRISLTFRCIKKQPECNDCKFRYLCDWSIANDLKTDDDDDKTDNCILKNPQQIEIENVHNVYDVIATHFSDTRHSPWPNVEQFVNSFQFGEILIDIGCGNGKYLHLNKGLFKIGCDRSNGLLNVCKQRQLNIFQCDCLSVPVRDCSVDGCMSIAVIHHLASKERRLQAIMEMERILIVGGRGLVYVWAKNQLADNKKSSYLKQNKKNRKLDNSELNTDVVDDSDYTAHHKKNDDLLTNLPIHKNRTQFEHQDILVPWKLKENDECLLNDATDNETQKKEETFLRYYHVFKENELLSLCKEIPSIQILKNYYDQGNWCIEFIKIKL